MGGGKNPLSSITNTVKGVASNFTGGMIGGQGQNANTQAVNFQAGATDQANAATNAAYAEQQNLLNPYVNAGTTALGNLTGDPSKLMASDPGYQFRLGEGQKGIDASMAARGLGNSGAALKALNKFNQNFASNEFGNAFNRQFSLAGMGQNAAGSLATAAGNRGANLSSNYLGLGNARAAGEIGKANQQAGFINRLYENAGTGMSMFSDARLKTNILEIDPKDLEEMQLHLKAIAFNYIDDKYGKGDWVGVMAQDLEKSKLGKTLVITDENGNKTIDQRKVFSMFLATMAKAA